MLESAVLEPLPVVLWPHRAVTQHDGRSPSFSTLPMYIHQQGRGLVVEKLMVKQTPLAPPHQKSLTQKHRSIKKK